MTIKPCTRVYDDGGAHTMRIKDGIATCVGCGWPIKDHKKDKQHE
jgi:hypothetical protein